MAKIKYLSGAEFKQQFAELVKNLADDDKITFGGGDLSLYRIKERGPTEGQRIVQIEFNETYTVSSD